MRPAHPSGRQFALRAGAFRATVVEVGGALRELYDGERPLLDGYGEEAMCDGARGQLLIPWPNRVDHGRYRFRGQEYQLELTEPERECAIHGLVRWDNWTCAERAPERVRMGYRLHPRPGWPHALDLTAEYALDANAGLTVRVTATNVGASTAPYGNGAHPYLCVGPPRIDGCTLQVPGAQYLPTTERGIPTGQQPVEGTEYDFRSPRRLGPVKIDYAYTALRRDADGRARVRLSAPDGGWVALWVDEHYPWVELFTGDALPDPARRRTGLGVEPMSCPPNAFVSGEGVIALEPGESVTTAWGIEAGR